MRILELKMEDKKVAVLGMTDKQWQTHEELLKHANQEQAKQMILMAALKLPDYRVEMVKKDE